MTIVSGRTTAGGGSTHVVTRADQSNLTLVRVKHPSGFTVSSRKKVQQKLKSYGKQIQMIFCLTFTRGRDDKNKLE
jgi:hypothetical protein